MTVPAVAAMIATTTGAALRAPIEPSIPHDFADPTVLSFGGTSYAYSTASRYGAKNFHVPVQGSTSVTGGWSHARDAMPQLPAWVDKTAVVRQAASTCCSTRATPTTARRRAGRTRHRRPRRLGRHTRLLGAAGHPLSRIPARMRRLTHCAGGRIPSLACGVGDGDRTRLGWQRGH
jgi:hypothetical protein